MNYRISRSSGRFWAAAVALVVGGLSACTEEVIPPTQILLTLESTLPVKTIDLRARNLPNVPAEQTITRDLGTRNITSEPLLIVIEPSAIAVTSEDGFLLVAIGNLNGEPVVSARRVLHFVANQQQQITLKMVEGCVDVDDDGICASGTQGEGDTLVDCDDRNATVNPFTLERCDDFVDNNCSGKPINEGCPCLIRQPPIYCTGADVPVAYAGVGKCYMGQLRCLDDGSGDEFGTLETVCNYGTFDNVEDPDNFIDDNCNGTVDEGGACTTGNQRSCLLGFVNDPNAPNSTAASDLARGECRTGVQRCVGGAWGSCEGEVPPQRDEALGFGWVESDSQCDGLDNDCDGFADDEPKFDSDQDTFTGCGTCIGVIRQSDGTIVGVDHLSQYPSGSPGLCDDAIDCNDANSLVYPYAGEVCGADAGSGWQVDRTSDEDCLCDHGTVPNSGESAVGRPYLRVDGTFNCQPSQRNLDCDLTPRSDPTVPGACADDPAPYYRGYGDALCGGCYFCGETFGNECDPTGAGACSTKADDCTSCLQQGALAMGRPLCRVPMSPDNCTTFGGGGGACNLVTCVDTQPYDWIDVFGVDPCEECPTFDCGPGGGTPYYWGYNDDTPGDGDATNRKCFFVGIRDGLCNGAAACAPRDSECDCDAGPFGCDATDIGAEAPGRPLCQVPPPSGGGCIAATGPDYPSWINASRGLDPYDGCPGAETCDGLGGCHQQLGDACNGSTLLCETGLSCVEGVCCETACDTACNSCVATLTGVQDGLCRPIATQTSDTAPTSLCTGATGCSGGGPCICRANAGSCLRDNGVACGVAGDCATNQCRTDWDQSGSFCAQDATGCVYDTGSGITQRAAGYVQCAGAGTDSYRVCTNGAWSGSATDCDAALCAPGTESLGCGYVTDGGNTCTSGQGFGTGGGCGTDLGTASCNNCGHLTATTAGCNSGDGNCSVGCGGACDGGATRDNGDSCPSGIEGNSFNVIEGCDESGGACTWQDSFVADTLKLDCGALDCVSGNCLPSCANPGDDNTRCNTNYHCDGGTCIADLADGEVCNEDSDCGPAGTDHCRTDWDGVGTYCTSTNNQCVFDHDGTDTTPAQLAAQSTIECVGDTHRTCNAGAWTGSTTCGDATCNSGCGFVVNADHTCSDAIGCVVNNCQDCGHLTAVSGGCATGATNCSVACGAPCNGGATQDAGDYCSPDADGNSFNVIEGCAESLQTCSWSDGAAADTLNGNCGDVDCNTGSGTCLANCGAVDANCNTGFHCEPGNTCLADVADGFSCDENSDCGSTGSDRCRTDWDGAGQFCVTSTTSCVYDHDSNTGTAAQIHATGTILCVGDSFRTCTNGVWSATTTCSDTTCDPDGGGGQDTTCGFQNNSCVDGTGCQSGTCTDCGDMTATASGCNTAGTANCSTTCGSPCNNGNTRDNGDYCTSTEGDVNNLIEGCAVVGSSDCNWTDASAPDTLNDACDEYDCNAATCYTSCFNGTSDDDTRCNAAFHCDSAVCVADVADGGVCNEDSDCGPTASNNRCRTDWDGTGTFCVSDTTSCVWDDNDDGTSANVVAAAALRCDEGASAGTYETKTCTAGGWTGAASCLNYICASVSACRTNCNGDNDSLCISSAHCNENGATDLCESDTNGGCDLNAECTDSCIGGTCSVLAGDNGTCDSGDNADCSDVTFLRECSGTTCKRSSGQSCATNQNGLCVGTCLADLCINALRSDGDSCDTGDNADCSDAIVNRSCFTGQCRRDTGQACSLDAQCEVTTACECTAAGCATKVCAAASCICGYGAAGACTTAMAAAATDPQDCEGAATGCGDGACACVGGSTGGSACQ